MNNRYHQEDLLFIDHKENYYKNFLKDIKKVESLRVKINKSKDIMEIAELSLLCISKLVQDEHFYNFNKRKIANIIIENY